MHRLGLMEQRLINEFQHDFPCVERPYEVIGAKLGLCESMVLDQLTKLKNAGIISRIGPVFAPGRIGCSTLAALAVPPARLAETADWISALDETNHNYEREDTFNLWFVITAADQAHLTETIRHIEQHYPFPLLELPLLEQFHIDLGFDLSGTARDSKNVRAAPPAHTSPKPLVLKPLQHELVSKLQSGIPFVAAPYAELWPDDPKKTKLALDQIRSWKENGVIKRFGIVVRHHELGYRENAMVVWDIPDESIKDLAMRVAQMPAVTLCYRRPRQMPHWPYNLFCMIHGKDRAIVQDTITEICRETGLKAYPMKILFSKRRFKQQGARYVAA